MENSASLILSLKNVSKSYGDNLVLDRINLDIKKGEFVTLLGASGCGKTTILRIVAGFESINSGEIYLGYKEISALEPHERRVNTVFQNYALFPHMNVYDNVAYGPKIRGKERSAVKKDIENVLELVKMTGYEKRMPHQLSGGQRQRIAIARALINEPDILLLDEPLGALDLKLRQHMQTELKAIQKATGITFIYVTHDQDEALYLSDRIAVMDKRNFAQIGTPEEIYRKPTSEFTARFVGERNILAVKPVLDRKDRVVVNFNGFLIEAAGVYSDSAMYLCFLQDVVTISETQPESNYIKATLSEISEVGSQTRLVFRVGSETVRVTLYNEKAPAGVGAELYLSVRIEDAALVKRDEEL